ncbi:MAG: 4-hydroxy-tetrahydrodipicolinate reductase [Planctomycetes bacterium]|nr:4-hydroxy-tetrahydrodipicolinate reductase [Planctomycetota bacterium]
MGTEAVRAVSSQPDLHLVAATDAGDDLAAAIARTRAEVVVDFTVASAAVANVEMILSAGASPVMGTSGFGPAEIEHVRGLCARLGRPALIAPNFALASVLLARFAAEAARYLPHVELIEAHHDKKEDSPSGTAIKVAIDIAHARREVPVAPTKETVPGVRGGVVEGVRVHAIRVPGLLARMECLFGGPGDTLTIRHDTLTRESFMPGVLLAVRRVRGLDGLVYGLEHLL